MGDNDKPPSGRHKKAPAGRANAPPKLKAKQSFRVRHRAWLITVATGLFITVFGGVLTAMLKSEAGKIIPPHPTPVQSTSTASPDGTPTPKRHGGRVQKNQATPFGPPLAVSEVPIDPGGNIVWMLPQKLIMSRAQLDHADNLLLAGQFDLLYDYLFGLGGYISSADTYFIVKNNRPSPIWIENIQIIDKNCQAPLTGTLINASDEASDQPRMQLGINLDSPDDNAMRAPGPDVRHWEPGYFSYPVMIKPGATYQFNIRAEASDVACIFRYEATILDDGEQVTQQLGDEPFRVSAFPQNYLHARLRPGSHIFPGYGAVYWGGLATPNQHGRLVQEYPRTLRQSSPHQPRDTLGLPGDPAARQGTLPKGGP